MDYYFTTTSWGWGVGWLEFRKCAFGNTKPAILENRGSNSIISVLTIEVVISPNKNGDGGVVS